MNIIEVENVSKTFGDKKVLNNIGFYKNTSIYNNMLLSARVANVSSDYADNLIMNKKFLGERNDV